MFTGAKLPWADLNNSQAQMAKRLPTMRKPGSFLGWEMRRKQQHTPGFCLENPTGRGFW